MIKMINKLDYFLYMNEAEGTGWVDTRSTRIEAAIKDFIMIIFFWLNIILVLISRKMMYRIM